MTVDCTATTTLGAHSIHGVARIGNVSIVKTLPKYCRIYPCPSHLIHDCTCLTLTLALRGVWYSSANSPTAPPRPMCRVSFPPTNTSSFPVFMTYMVSPGSPSCISHCPAGQVSFCIVSIKAFIWVGGEWGVKGGEWGVERKKKRDRIAPVSYTHLTLPTKA